MNILITGGAGFIGSNLLEFLKKSNYKLSILDNLTGGNTGYKSFTTKNFIKGDIRDFTVCKKSTEGIDAVVHLAARGNVAESVSSPQTNFENNALGTLNMLRACKENKVSRFVLASTGGALMGNCKLPVNEESVPRPISPYGASKLACEGYCHAFANTYGIKITILRFSNVYGPFSLNKTGIVNSVMKKISLEQDIVIYGNGKSTRDFIYVNDICKGIVKSIDNEPQICSIYHLGTGIETSTVGLAHMLLKITNSKNISISHLPKRKGEVDKNFASFSKAKKVLNFQPNTPLENGLLRTWNWYSKTINLIN